MTLVREPVVHELRATGAGIVLAAPDSGSSDAEDGRTSAGFTDEDGLLGRRSTADLPIDIEARAAARRIAARLSLPRPPLRPAARRGAGRLASLPFRDGADDIDLDRTLAVLTENPWPRSEDVVVRDRFRDDRTVILAVDVSGSMRGERIRTAAAAVGALTGELGAGSVGVLAFWSDAAWIAPIRTVLDAGAIVDRLLAVPARGLTNVGFPLELARRALQRSAAGRPARTILLSDCMHNAGDDPRAIAAGHPRLDVLLDVSGEHDAALGRDLARAGRGRLFRIAHHRDVAPALGHAFLP